MAIQINNISINFNNGRINDVNVYFGSVYDPNVMRDINLNGDVLISSQEYMNNSNPDQLISLITQRIQDELNSNTQPEPTPTNDGETTNPEQGEVLAQTTEQMRRNNQQQGQIQNESNQTQTTGTEQENKR